MDKTGGSRRTSLLERLQQRFAALEQFRAELEEDRARFERRSAHLAAEMHQLGRQMHALSQGAPVPGPATSAPPAGHTPEPRRRPSRTRETSLEEFVGGRLLAWVGGVAVLLGIVFFLGMAITRGWIDEPTRTVLAFLGSTALLLVGVWLHERRGRTEAALAAVAAALSGLFATLIVATQIYELITPGLGLGCAALVGVVGAAIAVRWSSVVVGAIGILGALLAPVLVGTGTSGLALAFMAVALSAAVAVLLWQRWEWLSLGAFLVSAPQLVNWITDNYGGDLTLTLSVIAAFWVLYLVAAIGYELRAGLSEGLPVSSWTLLLANAVLAAAAGYVVLDVSGHPSGAIAWLLALAGAHVTLGASALRHAVDREIGSLLVTVGLGLSALGFADALEGLVLVVGWAIQAVVLAYLATRASADAVRFGSNAQRLLAGSVGYLTLALVHILAIEAQPDVLFRGVGDFSDAAIALAALAAAALGSAHWYRRVDTDWAGIAQFAGAGAIVYLASVAIVDSSAVTPKDARTESAQVWLSAFWTLTGLTAVVYGLLRGDRRFRLGGLTLISIAIVKVYTYDLARLDEIARVLSFIAVGLLLLAGAYAYQRVRISVDDQQGRIS